MSAKKKYKKHRGFTLIELMVSISIIAVLSSTGYVTYSHAQSKARDAKRKHDLQVIQAALENYYLTNQQYPINTTNCAIVLSNCYFNSTITPANWLPDAMLTYFDRGEPIDPINQMNSDPSKIRAYAYTSSTFTDCPPAGHWYVLLTLLENSSDPQSVANTPTYWCDGHQIGPTQPSTWNVPGNAYVIVGKDR